MHKKNINSVADDIILSLKTLAEKKEIVRLKLAITAEKLAITADKLAVVAEEKEEVRIKLALLAKEKESARKRLVFTASGLAKTAFNLAKTAKHKENVRIKLIITAANLAKAAEKLAETAREKEKVRRALAISAAKLAVVAKGLAKTASNLVLVAKNKEKTRRKLVMEAVRLTETAVKEKERVRGKLAITAMKLAAVAEEKEIVRRKLAITAEEKEYVRRKLADTAKEKEEVRRKLALTAEKLVKSHETLENKVLERTKSLEMARAKEEAILLSIGVGLIATNEKRNIILINKTAQKLLGKNSREVVGRVFSEVIKIEDEKGNAIPLEKHPVIMALNTKTITTTTATGNQIYYYVRKDKTKFPVAITVTPVILNGKVIGTIEVFRDITDERQIDKAKTEFVSLASHQLRTPLSAVNWYTEMLLAGDGGELNQKQKKYLDEVYRSNQRMVELVNALLDVASLEVGAFIVEPEKIDICELANNVINEQMPQINQKRIILSFFCTEKTFITQADPKLLRMVIQNILSNSVKYTQEGGEIALSLSFSDDKSIFLKISDNGYGIPKNQYNKIFTKLFRADNVRDKDTDGTGLGLYIVKSIVGNSGGKIWFNSSVDEKNHGTTFYVRLPLFISTNKTK
jgi:PAS domain S-box-containing protein